MNPVTFKETQWINPVQTIHSYKIQGGVVEIKLDACMELQATIKKGGAEQTIGELNIIGIPKEIRLDKQLLTAFLKDSYVVLNGDVLRINSRLRGGGNSSSTVSYSYVAYQSPPPPNSHRINYNLGYTIRTVWKHPSIAPNLQNEEGGINCLRYCADIVTPSSVVIGRSEYDIIVLEVWKRDYYSVEISAINTAISNFKSREVQAINSKSETDVKIISIAHEIIRHQTSIADLSAQIERLENEQLELKKKLTYASEQLSSLIHKREKINPQQMALHRFMSLNEELGLGFDISHPSLQLDFVQF